jgi:hypothetical protein
MKNLKVISFELRPEQVVLQLSKGNDACEYIVNRAAFEDWLTDGTGEVDMSIAHHDGNVINEVEIKEPIALYWMQGVEVNDCPVLEHLRMYLLRNAASISGVKAEFAEERLRVLFSEMEPMVRADAYATLLEYGMLKKECGEQSVWQAATVLG